MRLLGLFVFALLLGIASFSVTTVNAQTIDETEQTTQLADEETACDQQPPDTDCTEQTLTNNLNCEDAEPCEATEEQSTDDIYDGTFTKGEVSKETVAGTNEPQEQPQVLGESVAVEQQTLADTGDNEILELFFGVAIFSAGLIASRKSHKIYQLRK